MTRFDFSPFYRSMIGFDHMTPYFERAMQGGNCNEDQPPYNILKFGDEQYHITLAVAGFEEKDLTIMLENGTLTVSGDKPQMDSETAYLHRGIVTRQFSLQFQLAEHVQVHGATLENGLLHIDLERTVPEALKPRTIEIGAPGKPKLKTIEGKAKAA